jgi:hypothetical protein
VITTCVRARTRSSCKYHPCLFAPSLAWHRRSRNGAVISQSWCKPQFHSTYQLEPVAIFTWLSPNDLPFAELKLCGADVLVSNLAGYAVLPPEASSAKVLVHPQIGITHPSSMQWLRIELLPRSYDLPVLAHVSFLSSLTGGVSYSFVQDAQQKLRCYNFDADCHLPQPHRWKSGLLVTD